MATNLAPGGASLVGDVAQLTGVRESLQWFTREKQWINEQHLELCRIPSPTFIEHRRAEWMAAQFRAYGCETQIDRAGNVLAFLEPGGKRPLVALTAHLDTVIAPKGRSAPLTTSRLRIVARASTARAPPRVITVTV